MISLKKDIDKNRDKKEVVIIVVGNQTSTKMDTDPDGDSTINKASTWCGREKIRHFLCNSYQRATLYEPFVHLASKLNPPPSKSTFPQLSMGRKIIKSEN